MKVNGRDFSIEGINNISDLLKKLNVNASRVVVELNKEIVPKEDYSRVNLKDDDTIEVVSFVGGG